jgi:hypothetical protein
MAEHIQPAMKGSDRMLQGGSRRARRGRPGRRAGGGRAGPGIDRTIAALATWRSVFDRLKLPQRAGEPIVNVLGRLHKDFDRA